MKAEEADRQVPRERRHFDKLLLQHPNYFGTLPLSGLPALSKIKSDTTYEELVCVGLNPPYDRLEGVIEVKLDVGYGGDICTKGSREFVRFFVDLYDDGVWHDVGVAQVRVHDIPGDKPLCYGVHLDFDAYRRFCWVENIVRVRAILQWSAPPPPDPSYTPVWGNVLEVAVQIEPRRLFVFSDLLEEIELDPPAPILKAIDLSAPMTAAQAAPLTLAQKQELYAKEDVPAKRFAFPDLHKLLKNGTAAPSTSTVGLAALGLDLDLDGLFDDLFLPTDGNTDFEELTCIGLQPEANLLEGVITVKRPSGFSGSLCEKGSTEYVAFWLDLQDGGGFHYLGTATVDVHDLQTMPTEGDVQYAVFLKHDLSKFQIPCLAGPRIARLRAILSWEAPPPPDDPHYVPAWGNREQRLVQLRPGEPGGQVALIETVGGIGTNDIDGAGYATGTAPIGGFHVSDSPFGGLVTITGRLGDPPDSYSSGAPEFKYRIEVFGPPPFDSWQPLTNPIVVKVSYWNNGVPQICSLPFQFVCDVTLTPTDDGDGLGDGWYPYLEDIKGPQQRFLVVDKLADWYTNQAMEGLWRVRLRAKDPSTSPPTLLPATAPVMVRIDNTAPSGPAGPGATPAQIEAMPPLWITSATFNGAPVAAEACGKFKVGSIISGGFDVHDPGGVAPEQHYANTTISVIPAAPANGATPVTVPANLTYTATSTNGVTGTWELDTGEMDACGYVLRLHAVDRTNVNSIGVGYQMIYDVGFCLESP